MMLFGGGGVGASLFAAVGSAPHLPLGPRLGWLCFLVLPPTFRLCSLRCRSITLVRNLTPSTPTHPRSHERQESSGGMSCYDNYLYEPVDAPLSRVDWSHEPVLRLSGCDLPQPREWTLADIGQEVRG